MKHPFLSVLLSVAVAIGLAVLVSGCGKSESASAPVNTPAETATPTAPAPVPAPMKVIPVDLPPPGPDPAPLLAQLTMAVRKFSVERRQVPKSLEEVASAGYLQGVPPAPSGYQFVLEPKRMEVILKKR